MNFNIWDIVTIIVFIGSSGLFGFGTYKAEGIAPKVISALTGLVFLVGLIVLIIIRKKAQSIDYITNEKLRVKLGKKNRPNNKIINQWEQELIVFWSRHYDINNIERAFRNSTCVFIDKKSITILGRKVCGYSLTNYAVIGFGIVAYVKGLFFHEMSHIILYHCDEGWNEKKHHQIME